MPASQIAPRVLGPAGSIVELSFKRVQGPAVLTINVTCVREPPRDQASVSPRAEATGRVSRPLAAESRASRSPAALQAEQADKQHNHDGNIHSYGKGAHSSLLTSSSSYDGFYERKTRGTSRLVSDGTRGSAGGTKWSDKDRTSTDFGLQPNGVQACEHDEESLRGRLDDTAQKHSLQDSIRGDDLDARSVERVPSDFDSPNVHDVHRTLMELAMVTPSPLSLLYACVARVFCTSKRFLMISPIAFCAAVPSHGVERSLHLRLTQRRRSENTGSRPGGKRETDSESPRVSERQGGRKTVATESKVALGEPWIPEAPQ
jgi:hypothetical protein